MSIVRSTRRAWLLQQAAGIRSLVFASALSSLRRTRGEHATLQDASLAARVARQAEPMDPGAWQTLALGAVDAARSAGAEYAEARLTRFVHHHYGFVEPAFGTDKEMTGVGVRVLMAGYWGFSASAVFTMDEVVRLAQDAVRQAKANAAGPPWTVDFGHYPLATGTWTTPVRVDPFSISIEDKLAYIRYWKRCADAVGLRLVQLGRTSSFSFARHERVVATSEGALFTQTLFESGGFIDVERAAGDIRGLLVGNGVSQPLHGIEPAGAGWELFLDTKLDEQLLSGRITQEIAEKSAIPVKPGVVGKYSLVCDGATMAALTEATLGVATQLDRALGYEANAGGTSWLDNPLTMVGTAQVTAPSVTLTANRSVPGELATVKWDEEGVEPHPFSLIENGVLVDFQTTREQAAWLASYYQGRHWPVHSHGCAMAESAHVSPLQQMPNLSIEPSPSAVQMPDLIADVSSGLLLEGGTVMDMDSQLRTGLLMGQFREIKNGRVGGILNTGAIFFDSAELWKSVRAVGGANTRGTFAYAPSLEPTENYLFWDGQRYRMKGEPPQLTDHTVRAPAAIITNQALIDPLRKA